MKYIHYCWFGNKPLPKLAKKCIKSWKKFLPDYEIIRWSEENVDLEECPFIKGAYDNKKWAFVSDYVRTKALNEMGGIYFDTDMEVTKDISELLKNDTFLGVEDSGYIAVGVWYEKNKNSEISRQLLKKYRSFKKFDLENITDFSIPKLISQILDKYGFVKNSNHVQILNKKIYIYPREYFYPYSYGWDNNIFTNNTCMIHYYDASWIPLRDRMETNLVRKVGRQKAIKILKIFGRTKLIIKKVIKFFLFPIVIYKNKKQRNNLITDKYIKRIEDTVDGIKNVKGDYITFYNKEWMGVTSATKELFKNLVDCGEIYRKKDVINISNNILKSNVNQVIFSSFAFGWKDICTYLKKKNKDLKIKVYWHGSHSQILDTYGWSRNKEFIVLHKKGIVDVIATCKVSLLNFYKNENYNAMFLTNKVSVEKKQINKSEKFKIGLYAAKCDDWRKNMFNQMAAISLIDGAVIDMVPLNKTAMDFAKILGVKIEGLERSVSREELLERMGKNKINLYVTYSECAPMLPLESMELGVVCITGNNHHYFEKSELEKFLVVNNEENILEIKNKVLEAIKNEKKILKLYSKFSEVNLKDSIKKTKDFLRK